MYLIFTILFLACQQTIKENSKSLSTASTSEGGIVIASQLSLKSLNGSPLEATVLEGKTVLYVNVASRCGYTSQYKQLQTVYEQYKEKGLQIVGVPCNQFGGQEPGSSEEIVTFCKKNYGVTFPLLEKQDVKGPNQSKLYTTLVNSSVGKGKDVRWNFEKFLVDSNGNVVKRFSSGVKPDSTEVTSAIELALSQIN